MTINFKDSGGKTILSLEIAGKEDSEGWLEALVKFDQNGFSARFPISLMLNDLYAFCDQLTSFSNTLKGYATFATIEDNVNLIFSTDGLGHITVNGKISHTSDSELKTLFTLQTDQTFLSPLLIECNSILKQYQP